MVHPLWQANSWLTESNAVDQLAEAAVGAARRCMIQAEAAVPAHGHMSYRRVQCCRWLGRADGMGVLDDGMGLALMHENTLKVPECQSTSLMASRACSTHGTWTNPCRISEGCCLASLISTPSCNTPHLPAHPRTRPAPCLPPSQSTKCKPPSHPQNAPRPPPPTLPQLLTKLYAARSGMQYAAHNGALHNWTTLAVSSGGPRKHQCLRVST